MNVYDEIKAERAAQDAQWGGPAHDDEHRPSDWIGYLCTHIAKAGGYEPGKLRLAGPAVDLILNGPRFRKQMVRVAALAVAAIESYDRRAEKAQRARWRVRLRFTSDALGNDLAQWAMEQMHDMLARDLTAEEHEALAALCEEAALFLREIAHPEPRTPTTP